MLYRTFSSLHFQFTSTAIRYFFTDGIITVCIIYPYDVIVIVHQRKMPAGTGACCIDSILFLQEGKQNEMATFSCFTS